LSEECRSKSDLKIAMEMCNSSNILEQLTNTNLIEEEIKRRLNSGNACYH
jgi:hypothetical protein